jgi:cell wall-associated NlpC family hydrolase
VSGEQIKRSQIVAEARTWLDTPWVHQGRLKGVGVDCIGLLACVAKDLGIFSYDVTGYSMQPSAKELTRHIEAVMVRVPVADIAPADAVLIGFDGGQAQHLAMISDYRDGLGIIHAMSSIGHVREHRLSSDWRRQIRRAYRFHCSLGS